MNGERPTWALLAPLRRERLAALADAYWREEAEGGEEFMERWEVMGGARDYSAVIDRNPGSEYTHEVPLAERISGEAERPVYVLYLDEQYAGADAVAVYEGGEQTGAQPAPYALARSLGLTLPGDTSDEPAASKTQVSGLLVVEGVSAADAARSLGLSAPPGGPLRIEDGGAGAVIYNEETGDASALSWRLSTAFPERDVYTVVADNTYGRFIAWSMRGGEKAGVFRFPTPPARDEAEPVLDSIKGETTPRRIVEALGIPAGLLNLDQWQ